MGAQGRTDVHVLILIDRHPAVGAGHADRPPSDGRHKKETGASRRERLSERWRLPTLPLSQYHRRDKV